MGGLTIKKYIVPTIVGITLVIMSLVAGQVNGGGTPTPTPIPDIFEFPEAPSVDNLLPRVGDLLKLDEDEDCQLPCFAGFHLNETPIEETTAYIIESFRQIPSISLADEREYIEGLSEPSTQNMDIQETFLPLSSEGGSLQVIFMSIDDIVVRMGIRMFMSVNWLEDNPFILSEILEVYGEPSNIYFRYSGVPKIGYSLAVVYEELGFIMEYGFGNNLSSNELLVEKRITEDGRLLICAEDHTYESIELTLQEDGNPIPLIETLQPSLDDPSVFLPFGDIEDMTGLSVKEFTEAFADNPEACIEAYSLAELRERGYE